MPRDRELGSRLLNPHPPALGTSLRWPYHGCIGLGFMVQGLGCRVEGLGSRV